MASTEKEDLDKPSLGDALLAQALRKRREAIATKMAAGLLAKEGGEVDEMWVAQRAVEFADALIKIVDD